MLQQRSRVELESMRRIKSEFMIRWDMLDTKPGEHVVVLAATNRPYDLDETAIRRFGCRVMVDMPSRESREKIFRTLLSQAKTEGLDFQELAIMTKGYTGSDLKNLCKVAAYQPAWELIQRKKMQVDSVSHCTKTLFVE